MLLYRLSTKEWQDDLSGESGKETDNFWTIAGNPCIYLHSSVANCLIENRVYQTLGEINPKMVMVEYEVPDGSLKIFEEEELPEEWRNDQKPSIARYFGTLRLQAGHTFLMAFPSVILRGRELVYLMNPLHPLMKEVRITRTFKPLY